jgi:hypothetical protein
MNIRVIGTVVVCLAFVPAARTQVSPALPGGWSSRDVGAVGQSGLASSNGATFTVSGAGADIWSTADGFHFAYRPLTGDGSIVAEVVSIVGAQSWTKMGVMLRAGTHANAAHAFMLVSTGNGFAFQRRTATGGRSTYTSAGTGAAPRWVKLTRTGSVITASVSSDGRAWTVAGSDTFSMPSTVLAGLVAHSHDPTRLATGTFANVTVSTATVGGPWTNGRLQVAPNGRFLRHATTGKHFFYLADTAWGLLKRLDRAQADAYLKDCAAKGFNAVQSVALWNWSSSGAHNVYGDHPLVRNGTVYDPARPLTTPGNDPTNATAYDFWDHVDYVIDRAAQYGLYVILEPTWGYYVSGTNSYAYYMTSNVFTVANARTYGEFLGRRYGGRPNIIWMLGGDRSAVYPNGDFRSVWRSLAEGIGRGATGQALVWSQPNTAWNQVLMTYHATRRDNPGSSLWFHTDPWLDFNGVQTEYHSVVAKVAADQRMAPAKPTAIVEPRYEDEYATDGVFVTGAFKQRYQLYHALLAGTTGYAYGHTRIWDFMKTGKTWQMSLNDPGRVSVRRLWSLLGGLSNTQLLGRVPDQTLLDGGIGTAQAENLLVAMRGGDRRFALVYSTNGRDVRLVASRLATGTADAYWFSPRTGSFYTSAGAATTGAFATVQTGGVAPIAVFNPPGVAGPNNDWILKLVVR